MQELWGEEGGGLIINDWYIMCIQIQTNNTLSVIVAIYNCDSTCINVHEYIYYRFIIVQVHNNRSIHTNEGKVLLGKLDC